MELKSLLIVEPWQYGWGEEEHKRHRQPPRAMWRIMVPVAYNNRRRIPRAVVKKWEKMVESIGKGYTANPVAKGSWKPNDSKPAQVEYMRPVDVFCQREQMEEIAMITAEYFRQKEVLYFKVSRDVNWFRP